LVASGLLRSFGAKRRRINGAAMSISNLARDRMSHDLSTEEELLYEEEFLDWMAEQWGKHGITLIKAPVLATLTITTIVITTDSIWRALLIGSICGMASMFRTWRRFLEPICLFSYVAAVAFWCWPIGAKLLP
jgi:hypothetical protein